tara:strand:+ start:29 stop:781 length:753 start_codon:yes stop_codon:yes gene_type:complete
MPNQKYKEFLTKITTEDIVNKMSEDTHACPPAAGSVDLNTKNRNATISKHKYGPLNVDEPGDYWEKIAKQWDTSVEAAKKSLCGNCVAFDISPRMDECMPGVTSDDDGRLGYCWMHHFKCHSARTCDTWAKGGPIKTDKISYEWHDRSSLEEDAPTNSVSGGGVDMAPNARHPLSKGYAKYKKDNEKNAKKIGRMVKENYDNNNNILKGVNETLDRLEDKIDEISGVNNKIVFEEKKEYKTFSEKFKVGK